MVVINGPFRKIWDTKFVQFTREKNPDIKTKKVISFRRYGLFFFRHVDKNPFVEVFESSSKLSNDRPEPKVTFFVQRGGDF